MKASRLYSIGGALLFILLFSCKNELNVLTDWKEVIVVYGLLNPADSAQYIKVSKVFLGEGNALNYAKEYDSVYYKDELIVILERWKNGSLLESVPLQKDGSIAKDSGIFHHPKHLLFKTGNKIYQDGSTYRIRVQNSKTGNLATAETPIVHSPNPQMPSKLIAGIDLSKATPFKMQWLSAKNGKLYEIKARFYYDEILVWDSTQVKKNYVDWIIGTVKSLHLDSGEVMTQGVVGENLFRILANRLVYKSDIYRKAGGIDFTYSIAADDFNTYVEVVNSLKSSQSEMIYTNIKNGIGLFSCRYTHILKNIQLAGASNDSLRKGRYTGHLGFK